MCAHSCISNWANGDRCVAVRYQFNNMANNMAFTGFKRLVMKDWLSKAQLQPRGLQASMAVESVRFAMHGLQGTL